MLDQDVDGLTMLFVLLVDHERFLVQSMLGSNLRNLGGIIVLQFIDVPDNFALVFTDGGEKQEVLGISAVAEGEGSMIIFSNGSMSSRSALMKAWTV